MNNDLMFDDDSNLSKKMKKNRIKNIQTKTEGAKTFYRSFNNKILQSPINSKSGASIS